MDNEQITSSPMVKMPAITVIIPMYNAAEYVGECLESLLLQTFRNFEVIVVDDCSTDDSVKIVEGYAPKFEGRLQITQTETNSGGCAIPRNVGFPLSRGEYVFFMDADDIIIETAFEEVYALAKEYDAEVVYCEKYYMSEGVGQEFKNNIHIADSRIQNPPFVVKPTLETNDLAERIKKLLQWNYWMTAWLKFVKRDLLIENNISFPPTFISEDDIWSLKLLFCSKRFLRIPNACYVRRIREGSIISSNRTALDQVQRWMNIIIRCLKDLDNFMGEIEFFRENPRYRYDIIARSVKIAFYNIFEKCTKESAFEVYKIFQENFGKYLGDNDVLVSSICSFVVSQQRELLNCRNEVARFKSQKSLGISIIIPMYNVEDYVGEMLDSLLFQTFSDFEVIIVDDCSTDNSREIVESYIPKFEGRLKLIKMAKNSGGAGEPRNIGLTLSRGEYIIFFDADDFILLSGLETLYKAAKKYDADVVYTSAYYNLLHENDVYFYGDGLRRKLLREGLRDEPTLIVDDQDKLLSQLLLGEQEGNLFQPWSKLVRREVLIENKINFPITPNCDDFIWVINVYSYAKRFLRIPTPFYFYRRHTASLSLTVREPAEQISYWISAFVTWAKALNALEDRTEILRNNPVYCYKALASHFRYTLVRTKEAQKNFTSQEIYELLHSALGKEDKFSFVLSLFFSSLDAEMKTSVENSQAAKRLHNFLTSRIDIQLVPKAGTGDFQILNVSDAKAAVTKPTWFQKGGIGYMVTSGAGKLEFVAKASVDGQIRLSLKGLDVRRPEDNSKRITYWINYNKLAVNGKKIFDKLTPAWHDKPYNYNIDVKGGEEVTIQVEWSNDSSVFAPPPVVANPSISVIIPMYNAEEYVGECLDSLLIQTFQDFEVIVVDDCSTDNSVKVVESYMNKFNDRLKLTKMKKNSGGGGYVPRNIGLKFAKGEYVIFVDSDDFLLGSALETLYNAAKEYDTEVVYLSSHYYVRSSNDIQRHRDGLGRKLVSSGLKDEPTLIVNNPLQNLHMLIFDKGFTFPWTKLIRRDFLKKNEILFPEITKAGDYIWTINLYCRANRVLRLPTALNFYRDYNTKSISRVDRSLSEQISYWVFTFAEWLKTLNDLISDNEILRKHPDYCYEALSRESQWLFTRLTKELDSSTAQDVYEILYNEFKDTDHLPYLTTIPFFFSLLDDKNKVNAENLKQLSKFRPTARMDIQLVPKTAVGDFKIVSISDAEADVQKPDWLQRRGIGYKIESYAGSLELVTKATANGQIRLNLKGIDVREPEDDSKRIPQWVDYTNLTINGKRILDKRTPAWHDKPYVYNMNIKADEEIKIEVEWLPHRDTRRDVSEVVAKIPDNHAEKLRKSETLVSELNTALNNAKKDANEQRALVSELRTALDNEKKHHNEDLEVLRRLKDSLTARIDIRLISPKGDFQILSVSDDRATISKPDWFQKDGVGYQIQSCVGQLKLIAKTATGGRINFGLKGPFVCDSKDPSKHLPYWIDYTKLIINDKVVFDALKPAWHDKPYFYNMNVKAGEEITVQVEWLPHRSDA